MAYTTLFPGCEKLLGRDFQSFYLTVSWQIRHREAYPIGVAESWCMEIIANTNILLNHDIFIYNSKLNITKQWYMQVDNTDIKGTLIYIYGIH